MATTRTNRWDQLEPPVIGDWSPRLRASLVIPYYDSREALRKTLIGVSAQTYPADLVEIIVVDDGSPTPLRIADVEDVIAVRLLTRSDEGFRLAAARNDGAAAANGQVLVFLDHDMIPDPHWLESHMRWHHVEKRAMVVGTRSHTDTGWLSERVVSDALSGGGLAKAASGHQVQIPEWVQFHMKRTSNLTSSDDDIFRVVTGGNLSISRDLFTELEGFNDSFVRWGGEDTELGYRAWVSGALLVPEPEAHCWHQGLGVVPDEEERLSQRIQRRKLAHLIPIPGFRDSEPGRIWQRARIVATVEGGDPDAITATTESLLRIDDVIVVIDTVHPLLIEDFGPDPRVELGSGDPEAEHRFSPFRARVPAGLIVSETLMGSLVHAARDTGAATTSDGVMVESRRHLNVGLRSAAHVEGRARSGGGRASGPGRVLRRLRRIRSLPDVWRTGRWLLSAIGRRLPLRRGHPGAPRTETGSLIRRLTADPWSRVVAVDLPSLPATGHPHSRVDLIVSRSGFDQSGDVETRTLVIEEAPDPDLLAYPPLQPAVALAVIRDRSQAAGPLHDLLRGITPESIPPGPRTGLAVSLAKSRDPSDIAALESIRRAALAEHLSPMRLDQLRLTAGLAPSAPSVSVIIASRRPGNLPMVVSAIIGQSYPNLELILATHGSELPDSTADAIDEAGLRFEIMSAPAEMRFGSVLAAASRRASGDLLAKMDDDDLYGSSHIEDLVNAHLLSSADIVGKAAEFVHLESENITIRRFVAGSYSDSRTIGGGALAITREAYDAVGGWADVSRHVDQALIRDVASAGGSVFRTHGLGYVLVRHGDHTWQSDERRFLGQAEYRWAGLPEWILSDLPPDGRALSH